MEPRHWTVDEANAALEWVGALVERARAAGSQSTGSSGGNGSKPAAMVLAEVVDALAAEGIVLRDVDRGLIDFSAVTSSGRPFWLCWVVGEPEVAWWHWPEDGFAGRTPVAELPE